MVELADTLGSGSSGGSLVGVRVPPSAPDDKKRRNYNRLRFFCFCWLRLGCVWLHVQSVDQGTVSAWDKVTIIIYGGFNIGMPKLFFHLEYAYSVTQQDACIGVPYVMKPHSLQFCLA